jgi:diaminohydroxyphosphoribosylaminopyrimidine deaminase/5-amino-6-(5-phosphoribosylamino)uracil reductase
MHYDDRQRRLMQVALAEAAKGKGATFPNPAVGAVVVKGERMLGTGFHKRWGKPHAEVEAMRDAGPGCKGADLYVTLEPCSHWGRTPPCTEAIISSGIKRVFVASIDPNPSVRGRGVRALRAAGISVFVGLEARDARRINETYFKFMKTGKPFVTLKVAQTLDGRIATAAGKSKWITSAKARRMARRMRAEAQAVLVGVNTVITDDPDLLPVPRRRTHYRCVLDSELSIPPGSRMVRSAALHPTVVYCGNPESARARVLKKNGVRIRGVGRSGDGLLRIEEVIADLGRQGVMHVLVEGGGSVSSSFLRGCMVDKIAAFIAPRILGDVNSLGAFSKLAVKSLEKCYGFKIDDIDVVGNDLLILLYPGRR